MEEIVSRKTTEGQALGKPEARRKKVKKKSSITQWKTVDNIDTWLSGVISKFPTS